MNKDGIKEKLSEEAYKVTQEGATEPAFSGEYHATKDDGMYHCIVCGASLFDSNTKFDSRTGWPSFYDTAHNDAVRLAADDSADVSRTEVTCAKCGAHLGHVFEDAPEMPTGQRYCINSCALLFGERKNEGKE